MKAVCENKETRNGKLNIKYFFIPVPHLEKFLCGLKFRSFYAVFMVGNS